MSEATKEANAQVSAGDAPSRRKYLIGGAIILAAVIYLLSTAARGATTYYLTVGELLAQGPSSRLVRVSGEVVEGTIDWSPRELHLVFEIADASGRMPAIYYGPRPDMFRDEAQVVLEGRYTADGTFIAQKILLKCPSKYEKAQ